MSSEFLKERGEALEESFFRKQNQKALEAMRAARHQAEAKQGLSEATGITDDGVLTRLVQLGITAETAAAWALFPLVHVAWADGKLEPKERDAVLQAAEAQGVTAANAAGELLTNWLVEAPDAQVKDAWMAYAQALAKQLSPSEREVFRKQVLGRAWTVADAAGGILGLFTRVSSTEEAAMKELEAAFA